VVEHGCLGRPRGTGVMVHRDRVEELGEHARRDSFRMLLDEAEAEMDVAEELPFVRREEERAPVELSHPTGVVKERGRDEKVRPQPRMDLRDVPAHGGDGDRVLEKPTGIGVMRVRCCGQRSQPRAKARIRDEPANEHVQLWMRELTGEELEEPVELVDVAAGLGDERRGIGLGRFERPHLELEAVSEALDPPEHVHRVAFTEALVEEVDVAPDPCVDPAARIDELQGQIRASVAGAKALLAGDRVRAFDDSVLRQLSDRHDAILGPSSAASLAAMALVKPFRALRYAAGVAGPLDDLVSPPYDVVSPERQARLLDESPYNAIRLVRPGNAEDAARLLEDWKRDGILVREDEPAIWLLEEHFVGPDGVARTRRSLVARTALEPYERGIVLPHERSFPKPRRGRLHLLEATRTKLSPILQLHDGPGPPVAPDRPPDLEAALDGVRSRLWRLPGDSAAGIEPPLVIADGHHRYEAALAFHDEDGTEETGHVLAAIVSATDPGLTIFPTHRVSAAAAPDIDGSFELTPVAGAADALETLDELPRDRAAFALLRPEGAVVARTDEAGLDTAVVDRFALEGVRFTPSAEEAARAVEAGEAGSAFLVRAPTVQQVETHARTGERMPEKSTYFFPKLAAGLLFAPFDE
jgi:hypothetical protein